MPRKPGPSRPNSRWRRCEKLEARALAQEALDAWHGMEDPYGFDWMAVFPAMAVALEEGDEKTAISLAAMLLADGQHPLPDELAKVTRAVVSTAGNGDHEAAALLREMIEVAKRLRYL